MRRMREYQEEWVPQGKWEGRPSGGMSPPRPHTQEAPKRRLANAASWHDLDRNSAEMGGPAHTSQLTKWSRRSNMTSRESLLLGGVAGSLGAERPFFGRTSSSDHFAMQPEAVREAARGKIVRPTNHINIIPSDPGPSLSRMTTNEALHSAPHKSFLVTPDKRQPPPYLEEQRQFIAAMMAAKFFDGRPTSAQHFASPGLPPSATRRTPIRPPSNPTPVGDRALPMELQSTHVNHFQHRRAMPAQPIRPSPSFSINPAHWKSHTGSFRDKHNRKAVPRTGHS